MFLVSVNVLNNVVVRDWLAWIIMKQKAQNTRVDETSYSNTSRQYDKKYCALYII